ncbi:MAG: septum site-determining protein MinD [SAR202 cluster bacterium]|nr:septum site-determining protein MinD [SAR202 cluster bacterium]
MGLTSATIIVITSGKGGVGKTTATANLGPALALRGNRVLIIDTDIGLRNLDVVMGLENRIVYDLVQVLEGTCEAQQAMIRDRIAKNLYLIPAAQTRDKESVTGDQLKELCESLRKDFEYILIDSPAGIEHGFQTAIAPADRAIVITTPEVSAVRDADRVIGLIESSGLPTPDLVLNRVRPALIRHGDMMAKEDILSLLSVNLIGLVPEDETIITSTNRGIPAVHDNRARSGAAFRRIATRIDGEDVPIVDLEQKEGIFSRLKQIVNFRGGISSSG